jgi:hypothetical protein
MESKQSELATFQNDAIENKVKTQIVNIYDIPINNCNDDTNCSSIQSHNLLNHGKNNSKSKVKNRWTKEEVFIIFYIKNQIHI